MSALDSAATPQSPVALRPAILIVEDEIVVAMDLQRTLIEMGYDAYAIASSADAAVQRANERRPDLVMMDIRIKGPLDGIQTASLLKRKVSPAIIFLTAHADRTMIERAKEIEPHGYLLKPVNLVELRTTVEIALYKHRLEQARAEKEDLERRQQLALLEMSRAVNESNDMLRMLIDGVKDYAIFMLDTEGRITSWNDGAARLKGYSLQEIVGQHFSKFYTAEDVAANKPGQVLELASRLGRAEEQGVRVRKDGTQFFADAIITAVHDPLGKLRGYAKVTRDITAHRVYEESLQRATREAERSNGAKSACRAERGHEIRTPLNAAIGLTYLLEKTALNAEQAELVSQINIASKLLLSLITDVLDLSKIEAGELVISRVAFSPRELLSELFAVMRVPAQGKGITLQLDVAPDLPAALEGDAARLNQILANLLSNAIKFTERGSVTLSVRLLENPVGKSRLSFTVRDTGIGIEPAAQARLFTPFIQADESIARRYGGTGLGLSIVKSLARLMGGTIDFTSTVGVGSEFRVVLEFTTAAADSLAAKQEAPKSRGERPLAGVRVLVVDDYDLNLVVARRILEREGALVWVAENGQVALEQLQRRPGHFDVVLMDVQMPLMDGYEATRRIRDDPALRQLPVIALTAGAFSSERPRAIAAGMDDLIIKPFDVAALISAVQHYSAGARTPPGESASELQPADPAAAWPAVEGIDMESARSRLCGDPELFRALLQRFLADFTAVAGLSSPGPPPVLAELASGLHKLKGGAGVLGALSIQKLAAQAESACIAGDTGEAGERLLELDRHLNALRASAARAFQGTQENRVLLVDDDDIVRARIRNLLELSGYRVGEAASGDEALRLLGRGDYQIMITDCQMPGMSGLELCRELRSRRGNRDLYVMVLTAGERRQDADMCLAAGADAYVHKGAPNEEIIARLSAALRMRQPRPSADSPMTG